MWQCHSRATWSTVDVKIHNAACRMECKQCDLAILDTQLSSLDRLMWFCVFAGSARTVNRRYIADFVSKDNRTKASAGLAPAVHAHDFLQQRPHFCCLSNTVWFVACEMACEVFDHFMCSCFTYLVYHTVRLPQ